MTGADLLESLKDQKEYFEELKRDLERLRQAAESVPATSLANGKTGSLTDRTGNNAVKIASMERRLEKAKVQYIRTCAKVYDLIEMIPDRKLRLVLSARYLLGMKWDDVADFLKWDRSYCFRLHKKALAALSELAAAADQEQ